MQLTEVLVDQCTGTWQGMAFQHSKTISSMVGVGAVKLVSDIVQNREPILVFFVEYMDQMMLLLLLQIPISFQTATGDCQTL